jgi:hypothetical protein
MWNTADWTNTQWHYVAGVLNSSANSLSVYYDGVLGDFITENNQPDSDTATPMYFASREVTSLFSDKYIRLVAQRWAIQCQFYTDTTIDR